MTALPGGDMASRKISAEACRHNAASADPTFRSDQQITYRNTSPAISGGANAVEPPDCLPLDLGAGFSPSTSIVISFSNSGVPRRRQRGGGESPEPRGSFDSIEESLLGASWGETVFIDQPSQEAAARQGVVVRGRGRMDGHKSISTASTAGTSEAHPSADSVTGSHEEDAEAPAQLLECRNWLSYSACFILLALVSTLHSFFTEGQLRAVALAHLIIAGPHVVYILLSLLVMGPWAMLSIPDPAICRCDV